MTNDNAPQSKAVPTDEVAWGDNIGLMRGVLYRRFVGGPDGEEWRPEPEQSKG
jgi:hypothetical protein